jgi:hypothetical protein
MMPTAVSIWISKRTHWAETKTCVNGFLMVLFVLCGLYQCFKVIGIS